MQAERARQFLQCGGQLDRACPGCGKQMSRQRNLVSHLLVMHGVEVAGRQGQTHQDRYNKDNQRVKCDLCSRAVSRKSYRRHLKLCHPEQSLPHQQPSL